MKSLLSICFVIASISFDVGNSLNPVYPPKASKFQAQAYFQSPSKARHFRHEGRAKIQKLKTETVYGFLDFTTTIGSTVMVFTPQEEKKTLSGKKIQPSSTLTKIATTKPPEDAVLTPRNSRPKENPIKLENQLPPAKSSNNEKISKDLTSNKSSPTGLAALLRKSLDKKGERKISFSSRPFRNSYKNGPPPETKKRPSFDDPPKRNFFNGGGSTIIPITVEGTGTRLPTKIIEATPIITTSIPKEVVVTAEQKFPPLKAIGPFTTEVNNAIESDTQYYDHLLAQSSPTVTESFSIFDMINEQHFPLPETKIVYTASEIEVNTIDNYFSKTPIHELPKSKVHSVSVIEGSSTEFFRSENTVLLPLESLFSPEPNRDPRNNEDIYSSPKFSRRRGPGSFIREEPAYYQNEEDQYYDDSYDYDLQRAGSESRLSFNDRNPAISASPASEYYEKPTIYRNRFRGTGTRNSPPPLQRRSRPGRPEGLNRFRLNGDQRAKLQTERLHSAPLQRTKKKVVKIHAPPEPFDINDEEIIDFTDGNVLNLHPSEDSHAQGSALVHNNLKEPLFENILDAPKEIATLPPIDLKGSDLHYVLKTITDSYHTTETIYKTSVLPVIDVIGMKYHTLTQTYLITRIVSAIKTVPPIESFEFVPGNSLNEFNTKLVAEGTENRNALLQSELEFQENGELRADPTSSFLKDIDLADLAGGRFKPDVLEKQMHPELASAISNEKPVQENAPEQIEAKPAFPGLPNLPTPALSPEQLQMAYLRIINPYLFGGLPGIPGATPQVTSTPVVVSTEFVTTVFRKFPIQFNDRKIVTTLMTTSTVRTTTTIYQAVTAATPQIGFPAGLGFPYPQPLAYTAAAG